MYFSTIIPLLAATGALAAPLTARSDNSIRVSLTDNAETGAQVTLPEGARSTATPATSGPFASVQLTLGPDVQQQDLRCQVLDVTGNPILLERGENIDTTFSDAGKGPWGFVNKGELTKVTKVICDPSFVSANAPPPPAASLDLNLTVILLDPTTGTESDTILPSGDLAESKPNGTKGPFQTVKLTVGKDVEKQDYRCQVLDKSGNPLIVLRGANRDITFSDADKGPWTLEAGSSKVHSIICDPNFVADNLNASTTPPPATSSSDNSTSSDSADLSLRVTLTDPATETASQTTLESGDEASTASPIGTSGPFQTVELTVGKDVVNQAYRCQILDVYGNPLIVLRGANRDTTFSDADKGAWTIEAGSSKVSEIVCDTTFVANNLNASA